MYDRRGVQRQVCLSQGESQRDASENTLQSMSLWRSEIQRFSLKVKNTMKGILVSIVIRKTDFQPILSISYEILLIRLLNYLNQQLSNNYYHLNLQLPNTKIYSLRLHRDISPQKMIVIIHVIKNLLIVKEQLFMEAENLQKPKTSLCRFYLRGLCIKSSKDCPNSHGVWDLNYDYMQQGEIVQYQYHKSIDHLRNNKINGPRIYTNLYEFQTQKVFTLAELNQNRQIRSEIRKLMHQQLYMEFMQLLEIKHIDTVFTEEFLLREFTRVGFNKILMEKMKFNHITAYLCDAPNSLYFKTTRVIPPSPQKQNCIVKRASEEQRIQAYKNQYLKLIQNNQEPIQQSVIKKKLFTAVLPENVPALNLLLRDTKLTLSQFISHYLGLGPQKIISEASPEQIQTETLKYLEETLDKEIVSWNQVYNHLTKALKSNNGNIINQVKPSVVQKGNMFLFFPMIQFIYNYKISQKIFINEQSQPCKCNFQKPYSSQQLLLPKHEIHELKQGQSYDINNFQTLVQCAPHILNSHVLGVDLQGNLRKGGFVQMIQLNNGRNTFLIDIWMMNENGDFQTFWLARKILRNVMVNGKILKIFHDCRHDSIGLHEMIQTCIINVFDTSACETLIMQLNSYEKIWSNLQHKNILNDCKNVIANCNNVKTPGLNEILKKYEASHGTNKNKDKYHKMWSKGEISFFCMRPLDPDYRQYCIKDVLDLPEIHKKMLKFIPQQAVPVAYWISQLYAKTGYLSTEEGLNSQNI